MTWSFFHDCKTTHLDVIFLNKKLNLYIFFQKWLFDFNAILQTSFKIYLEKLRKNFALLNKSLEPYKLP